MMCSWRNSLAKYNTDSGFSSEVLLDNQGLSLVGVYALRVTKINAKLSEPFKKSVALCCSLYTSYSINNEGILKKQYAPVDIFTLDGAKGQEIVIPIIHDLLIQFSDVTNVSFWLQDLEKKKIKTVQLDVLFAFRKWL